MMGLDTRSYGRITLVPGGVMDEGMVDEMYDGNVIEVWADDSFPHALDGLPLGEPGREGTLWSGWYRPENPGPKTRHSYSGYNLFRARLSVAVLGVEPQEVWNDPARFKGSPYFDLIHFSDCEGVLGPKACERLARDFTEHEVDLDEGNDEWYSWNTRSRDRFRDSFVHAANGGCVVYA